MTKALLDERINTYGTGLGELFHFLLNEWSDLWLTYKQYDSLFGANQERVDLLNKHGGVFFFNVERQFWNASVMGVCRLTDPVKTSGKPNLTIQRLPSVISDVKIKKSVEDSINIALDHSRYHRELRNKIISHNDLDVVSKRRRL